jgi:hypothetical protein
MPILLESYLNDNRSNSVTVALNGGPGVLGFANELPSGALRYARSVFISGRLRTALASKIRRPDPAPPAGWAVCVSSDAENGRRGKDEYRRGGRGRRPSSHPKSRLAKLSLLGDRPQCTFCALSKLLFTWALMGSAAAAVTLVESARTSSAWAVSALNCFCQ